MHWLEFYKNKKVLITGHTGFKGTWRTHCLLQAGEEVLGYSLPPAAAPNFFDLCKFSDKLHSVNGDIRNLSFMESVFNDFSPELVIHMAAQPIVRESYRVPAYTYEVNVMGTVNVMECVRKTSSVRSVINVTTDKVYKNQEWCWGYRENEELNGYDPYSNSKSCSELVTSSYINSFLREKGVAVSTVRAGNVIGGGDFAADRIIPDSIRAAAERRDIIVRNPYSIRPYQHVLEPVAVYLELAARQAEHPELAGSYNVGPDETDCLTTGELVTLFCRKWEMASGTSITWKNQCEKGPHEAGCLKLDCSKLKNSLGWKPVWNIDQAMEKLAEWYQAYLSGNDIEACTLKQIQNFLSKDR